MPHPLYLEGKVEGSTEDTSYEQEEAYLDFSNSDEVECPLHESGEMEVQAHIEGKAIEDTEDPEIDDYYKQFVDFMQAQFNRRYDLRSSRKRTRTQDQEEDTSQEEAPARKEANHQKTPDKGKRPLNQSLKSADQIPSSSQVATPPRVKLILK